MRVTGEKAPIQLMWNDSSGEGFILFDPSFQTLPDVTKLDMLQDFIAELQTEYEEQMEMAFEDFEEPVCRNGKPIDECNCC